MKGLHVSARFGAGGTVAAVLVVLLAVVGCAVPAPAQAPALQAASSTQAVVAAAPDTGLPGMPPVTDPDNVYAAAGAGMLSDAARRASHWSTCRTTKSRDVWVIDPAPSTSRPLSGGGAGPACRALVGHAARSTRATTRANG